MALTGFDKNMGHERSMSASLSKRPCIAATAAMSLCEALLSREPRRQHRPTAGQQSARRLATADAFLLPDPPRMDHTRCLAMRANHRWVDRSVDFDIPGYLRKTVAPDYDEKQKCHSSNQCDDFDRIVPLVD